MASQAYSWLIILMMTGMVYFIYPIQVLYPIAQPLFWFSLIMFGGTIYLMRLRRRLIL